MPDPESEEKLPKSGVDKLAPLVRYKVSGDSETSHGFEEKNPDFLCGGLFGEDAEREGHSREDVQDDCDLEAKEAEESGNIGQVGHPDVTRVMGLDGTRFESVDRGSFGICRRWFFPNSADGFRGDFPPGSCECLGDELVPTESEPGHGLDEPTDNVGVSANGRVRPDGGVLLGRIHGRRFPPEDGVAREAKHPCRLFGRKCQEISDAKDTISLLGSVMRTFSFRDLFPPRGMDFGDIAKEGGMKGIFFDFGIADQKGILGVSELGDAPSDGETEKFVGFSESSESRAIDLAVLDESAKNPIRIGGHVHGRLRNGRGYIVVGDFY